MRIVCWQTILMKYHTLFFWKLGKMSQSLSPAAVVIGALRVIMTGDWWAYHIRVGQGAPMAYVGDSDSFPNKQVTSCMYHRLCHVRTTNAQINLRMGVS